MLLKSLIKARKMLALSLALVTANSWADEQQNVQFHGFIAQGIAKSQGSDFVNDDQDVSAELTEIGFNISYQINEQLRFAGQAVYLNAGNRLAEGGRIDYALFDWSVFQTPESQLNLYLGRYKNYHWLYSSTRDVPMTRPSIVLPQAIYFDGFRDIAVGGDGVALSYKQNHATWGDFDFNLSYGTSSISDKQTEIILSELATGRMNHDLDYQGSIFWQPQNSQWRFGIAALDSEFTYDQGQSDSFRDATIILQRYLLNGRYEGELWEFSGEIMQERFLLEGFYSENFRQDNFGQGFFVQSRYLLNENTRLLVRLERFYANKDDRRGNQLTANTGGQIPHYFGYQHDTVVGLSIRLAEHLELQLEHHWFEGTARLTPVVVPNTAINNDKHWQLWSAQLMYWF
ncbi:hypothetical protein [Thalassotalea montiporae]